MRIICDERGDIEKMLDDKPDAEWQNISWSQEQWRLSTKIPLFLYASKSYEDVMDKFCKHI